MTSTSPDVRRAALWARELLDGELGLTSFVRTSGGRGLHVHVALNRRADFDVTREFAHHTADVLARRHPDVITTEQRKDKRGNRIYADVMRNDPGLKPGQFTMVTIRARLASTDDPWSDFTSSRHGLGEAGNRLAKLAS
jgi:bifunctional non-homologous end joining protein LigD